MKNEDFEKLPLEEQKRLLDEACKWIESEEGRRAILESISKSKEIAEKLKELSRIKDWRKINEPMTI